MKVVFVAGLWVFVILTVVELQRAGIRIAFGISERNRTEIKNGLKIFVNFIVLTAVFVLLLKFIAPLVF